MNAHHVTLEPNEHNRDACALTLYFQGDPTAEQVLDFVRDHADHRFRLGLWVDADDPHANAEECVCPSVVKAGFTRWQVHPTA